MAGTTRRKPGWMSTYIEGLRAWLLKRGYTPGSIKYVLTLTGQLGRWMQSSDVKWSSLVAEYRTWLVVDRGLSAATVLRYENLARRNA